MGFGIDITEKAKAERGRYSIGKTERKTVIYDEDFLAFLCVYFVVQCVVLGDGGVGKTSLLMSYAQDRFPDDYTATGESTLLINEGNPLMSSLLVIFVWGGVAIL